MIWAGAVMNWAGAVMIWAGAVMIWAGACSKKNYPTLKMPKNAKKAKCDGRTDRPTDTVAYRSRVRDKKEERMGKIWSPGEKINHEKAKKKDAQKR